MIFYLESQDGTQSYQASFFCNKKELVDGKLYSVDELQFEHDLKTAGAQHKPPQKKLKAVAYGS